MKLSNLIEARYAQSQKHTFTGILYTGSEGEFSEKNVTITLQCNKERISKGHYTTEYLCKIENATGGELTKKLVYPSHSVRLVHSTEGWMINGFVHHRHVSEFNSDSWSFFDENYKHD